MEQKKLHVSLVECCLKKLDMQYLYARANSAHQHDGRQFRIGEPMDPKILELGY